MPHSHGISSHGLSHLGEECITNLTGCLLKGAVSLPVISPYIMALNGGGDTEAMRQLPHILSIGIGFSPPQQVIEMGDIELDAKPVFYFIQGVKQAH
jgi:hypothetical protein